MQKIYLLFLLLLPALCSAQDDTDGPLTFNDWKIKPILGFQGWGTHTTGFQDFNVGSGSYVDVDNRTNFMVRRLRFGSTAQVGERILIKFLGAADFVGSDQRSATIGGVNNGGFPVLQVWDIFAQYRITAKSEGLYVIGGYMRPPIGRESMSGALGVSSMEKGFNQWYVRQHLVGTGPGGAGGVYLGGLTSLGNNLHVDYRGGMFNPQNNGISVGPLSSPLYAGRLNIMIGDREKATWSYGLPAANSFGKRRTAALAFNVAQEGPTSTATGGVSLLGLDALVNVGQFHAEGEYHAMTRKADGGDIADLTSATYMFRTGFNLDVTPEGLTSGKRYLEPTVMVYGFNGALTLDEYRNVLATNYFGGQETVVDVGLNYHLRPGKVRLGLHYVAFSGDRGELPEEGRLSWYWSQAGIGGIQRGNYAGVEVILNY